MTSIFLRLRTLIGSHLPLNLLRCMMLKALIFQPKLTWIATMALLYIPMHWELIPFRRHSLWPSIVRKRNTILGTILLSSQYSKWLPSDWDWFWETKTFRNISSAATSLVILLETHKFNDLSRIQSRNKIWARFVHRSYPKWQAKWMILQRCISSTWDSPWISSKPIFS